MKRLLASVGLLLTLSFFTELGAQTNPVIYKDWTVLGESKTQIDVSYRVLKCTTVPQVHLFLFNENPNEQTADFELEIIDGVTEKKVVKHIVFKLEKGGISQANCESDASLNALKINLPDGYDPLTVSFKLTFKQ